MFKDTITKIFESDAVTGFLALQRTEMDDQTFMKLLALKPGEVNIVLARVATFIRNDSRDKTRKELINEILEVLERSAVARKFVGIGLKQEYRLFKGFPVRKGDPYEQMPNSGSELILKPTEVYIGWSTDSGKAREDGVSYDATKGEPVGGLLVETHIDSNKILFDVNAVLNAIKSKLALINQYNAHAAPGKSISKTNTDFLATEAPAYHGPWEVITSNKIVNTRVADKWNWDNAGGKKVPKWVGSAEAKPVAAQPVQENLKKLFENVAVNDVGPSEPKEETPVITLPIFEYQLEEGFMDKLRGIGDWISKTAGVTVRGKTLKYLELLVKQYQTQKLVYELAYDFASKVDPDEARLMHAEEQMSQIDQLLMDVKTTYEQIKNDPKQGLSFVNVDGEAKVAAPEGDKENKKDAPADDDLAMPDLLADMDDEEEFKESLHNVFESALGIFAKLADTKIDSKDRVTRRQLDKIFNKLIGTLAKHYDYRLRALQIQLDLLETDFKSYQGSRFENLPQVQKLGDMVEYTRDSLELVERLKAHFEASKDKADNFAFTSKVPDEDAKTVATQVAGDKPETKPEDKTVDYSDDEKELLAKKKEVEALLKADKKVDALDSEQKELVNVAKDAAQNDGKPTSEVAPVEPPTSEKPTEKMEPVQDKKPEEPKAVEPTPEPVKAPEVTPEPTPTEPLQMPQAEPEVPADEVKKAAQAPAKPKKKKVISVADKINRELKKQGFVKIVGKKAADLFAAEHPEWKREPLDKNNFKFTPADAAAPESAPEVKPEPVKAPEPTPEVKPEPVKAPEVKPEPTAAKPESDQEDADIPTPVGEPELPVANKDVDLYMDNYAQAVKLAAQVNDLKKRAAANPGDRSLGKKLKAAWDEYKQAEQRFKIIAQANPKFPKDKVGLDKLLARWKAHKASAPVA